VADDGDAIIPSGVYPGGFRLWTPVPNPGSGGVNVGGDIYIRLQRNSLGTSFVASLPAPAATPTWLWPVRRPT